VVGASETDGRLTWMAGDGLETHGLAELEVDSAFTELSRLMERDFGRVSVSYDNSQ